MKSGRLVLSPEAMNASGLNPVAMVTAGRSKIGEFASDVKERLFGFVSTIH